MRHFPSNLLDKGITLVIENFLENSLQEIILDVIARGGGVEEIRQEWERKIVKHCPKEQAEALRELFQQSISQIERIQKEGRTISEAAGESGWERVLEQQTKAWEEIEAIINGLPKLSSPQILNLRDVLLKARILPALDI